MERLRDLTAVLAPLLPYLQQLGDQIADQVGSKFSESLWNQAVALWKKIVPHVEEDPLARGAVEDLARRPEDHRARGAMELQLEKIFQKDTTLAGEVAKLLESTRSYLNVAHVEGNGAIAQGSRTQATGSGGISAGRDLAIGIPTIGPEELRDRE